jgi:hypothetical protein
MSLLVAVVVVVEEKQADHQLGPLTALEIEQAVVVAEEQPQPAC